MKRKRKLLWLILPVILIAAAAGTLFWFRAHPVQVKAATIDLSKITTTKVVVGTVSSGTSATGTVRTNQNSTLAWGTSGTVSQVLVKKGGQVQANQILAQIDPSSSTALVSAQANLASAQQSLADLQDVSVSQANAKITLINAQAAVDTAQTALNDLEIIPTQANIDAANATYLAAQQKVNSLQKTYDGLSGIVDTDVTKAQALSTLETAIQERDTAAANLDYFKNYTPDATSVAEAQAALDLAKAQLTVAQADYDAVKNGPDATKIAAAQAAIAQIQAQMDQQYIRAPFAGTITTVNVAVGDQVTNGMNAFRIDDESSLFIDLQVSEVDINTIQTSQAVELTFDAIADKTYNAKVTDIGSVGTVSGGVANFTVTAVLSDADDAIRPGMTATANVITQQVNDALLVPNHAITSLGTKKVVYVLANSQVSPVTVTVGLASDTQTQVTSSNLKSEDLVVTNPTSLTSTTTTTGVSSVFGNLFSLLGVTTRGTGLDAGGPGGGLGGGDFTPPSGGNPPSGGGGPSGNPPSGNGG